MKIAVIVCTAAVVFCHGITHACSIQNRQDIQIGDNKGVTGVCSNNGAPISCSFVAGEGITCDGPGGSFNGDDLNALIYSSCGCSAQEDREQLEKKAL